DDEERPVHLAAGVPALLRFRKSEPGDFTATILVDDACPANNRAVGQGLPQSDKPKILALSKGMKLPEVDLDVAESLPPLGAYDAVILDNIPLQAEQQQALAEFVRGGRGLVLLGGDRSYGLGDWQRKPLEALSPLKLHPDLKIAAVLGIDSSGSMSTVFD